jgi:hypothetical protein
MLPLDPPSWELPAVPRVFVRCVVARMRADLANGARMGDGGRKVFLLCEGGAGVLAVLAAGLVDGRGALLGNNRDPSLSSSIFKAPDLMDG